MLAHTLSAEPGPGCEGMASHDVVAELGDRDLRGKGVAADSEPVDNHLSLRPE
jgi:hypothetical protein